MALRRWDPRLDPRLRPDEWDRVARRRRRWAGVLSGLVLGALLGVAVLIWYPRDLTTEMTPEAIAEAAGRAILQAGSYKFTADLQGVSRDQMFPSATMHGAYQREPHVLHLEGSVLSGDQKIGLEYYLDGQDLYIKHPVNHTWMLLKDSPLDELASFYPDNLAAPLLGGLRKAEVIRRERLPEGYAVLLGLDLDPNVMLPNLHGLQADRVMYRLWVYTHTLRPARFIIDVRPNEVESPSQVVSFSYQLDWDFGRMDPLAVPDAVRQAAAELSHEEGASLLPEDQIGPADPDAAPADGETTEP